MKLILTADVEPLGKRGDVVDVAEGYARNFLLPRRKAIKANEGALRQAEAVREARLEMERRRRKRQRASPPSWQGAVWCLPPRQVTRVSSTAR